MQQACAQAAPESTHLCDTFSCANNADCAGHGTCDTSSGTCSCASGFAGVPLPSSEAPQLLSPITQCMCPLPKVAMFKSIHQSTQPRSPFFSSILISWRWCRTQLLYSDCRMQPGKRTCNSGHACCRHGCPLCRPAVLRHWHCEQRRGLLRFRQAPALAELMAPAPSKSPSSIDGKQSSDAPGARALPHAQEPCWDLTYGWTLQQHSTSHNKPGDNPWQRLPTRTPLPRTCRAQCDMHMQAWWASPAPAVPKAPAWMPGGGAAAPHWMRAAPVGAMPRLWTSQAPAAWACWTQAACAAAGPWTSLACVGALGLWGLLL